MEKFPQNVIVLTVTLKIVHGRLKKNVRAMDIH